MAGYKQSGLVRWRLSIMNSPLSLRGFKSLGLCCFGMFIFICVAYRNVSSKLYYTEISRVVDKTSDQRIASIRNSLPLYYVESSRCKIPYIDPFAADVMEIYKPQVFEKCSNESDLVRPIYDVNSGHYVLHINSSGVSQMLNSSEIQFKCYYQEIKHNDREVPLINLFKLMSPVYFEDGFQVPLSVHAVLLNCHKLGNESNILQVDGYALVQNLPTAVAGGPAGPPKGKKPKLVTPVPPIGAGPQAPDMDEDELAELLGFAGTDESTAKNSERRKASVIMFGIDTMSSVNVRRMMPNTLKFLKQPGWYEMQGYNKVADNTFPNLLAVLSGYSTTTAKQKVCNIDVKGCLDKFPFIWKYLKKAGYLTAYAEDASYINTFTLRRPGFERAPTDYYHLLFMQAFERKLQSWKCANCTMDYCYGRRLQSSYVFDYMREYASRYVAKRPVWGLFWSSSFTHDDFLLASKMDNYVIQYFKDFEADGVLAENIVIFFSDHGSRFGELRSLSSGFLESRLPMLFIYLPPWFRAQYPEYAAALELNRNRLTSNYDLHNTLKHIIELGAAPNATSLPRSASCPTCQSLFYPIKEQRSCADAAIPDHFCTCEPYKSIKYTWTDRMTELVVEHINEYLWAKNLGNLCANLTLNHVENVKVKIGLDMEFPIPASEMKKAQYQITFIVKENDAIFFATLVYNNVLDVVDVDVETINRLNSYSKDSFCIEDRMAQLFCICKIQLPIRYKLLLR